MLLDCQLWCEFLKYVTLCPKIRNEQEGYCYVNIFDFFQRYVRFKKCWSELYVMLWAIIWLNLGMWVNLHMSLNPFEG